MSNPARGARRSPRTSGPWGPAVVFAALAWAVAPGAAHAKDHELFRARAGMEVAEAAAKSWASDAFLVYIENDEAVDAQGAATRWGYLFYSPALDKSRAYSIRDGKILVAEYLDKKFEAPPLAANWIDSDAALQAAAHVVDREFRHAAPGELRTMLLMRGAFQDEDPDQTTWTLIYGSQGVPPLFVVVDAVQGKVRRTWRG